MSLTALLWCAMALAQEAPVPKSAPPPVEADEDPASQLAHVRRIFVDVLTGGGTTAQFRDIIISSLEQTKAFVITESEDKADAILKGAADDSVFKDVHDTSDSLNASAHLGSDQESNSGRYSSEKKGSTHGLTIGEHEQSHIEERRHEAFAAVRLVGKNGDVIWSSTEESLGGKYAGAAADVAARIARQLAADFRRARSAQLLAK